MGPAKGSAAGAPAAYGTVAKLPPVAAGCRVRKRPLVRRQLVAADAAPVLYLAATTPFMAAVRRVQKLLDKSLAAGRPKASLQTRIGALAGGRARVPVIVRGSGRLVAKTVQLASWFQQAGDCEVELKTGTVAAIDDLVGDAPEPETRLRRLSYLELVIRLK